MSMFKAPKILPTLPTFGKKPQPVSPVVLAPVAASSPTAPTGFLKGGDFSHFNAKIDTSVYPIDHQFLATKAMDGLSSTPDSAFNAMRAAAHKMGIPFIGYHFFRFADVSPQQQARNFLNAFGALQKGEGIAGDYEWDNHSSASGRYGDGKATDAHGNDLFFQFKTECEQLFGVPLIIYTGKSFMPMVDARFSNNPLWVFDYHTTARSEPHVGQKPILPPTWAATGWKFWQYTDREETKGSGGVDMNVFSGSVEDMRKLTKQ